MHSQNANYQKQFVLLPSAVELEQFQKIIENKLDNMCEPVNELYLCPNDYECMPVQENVGNLMKLYPNANIKVPLFKLHSKCYGTDTLSAFSIDIDNFLKDWQLSYKANNDTFSYLFINKNELLTFSNIKDTSRMLCNLSPNQILLNNHFKFSVELILSELHFFMDLYKKNKRQKLSSLVSE